MTDLHSAAEELRRIEAMVEREFAKIPPPVATESNQTNSPAQSAKEL